MSSRVSFEGGTDLRKQQHEQREPSRIAQISVGRVFKGRAAAASDDDDDKETICWPYFLSFQQIRPFETDRRTREGGRETDRQQAT